MELLVKLRFHREMVLRALAIRRRQGPSVPVRLGQDERLVQDQARPILCRASMAPNWPRRAL